MRDDDAAEFYDWDTSTQLADIVVLSGATVDYPPPDRPPWN